MARKRSGRRFRLPHLGMRIVKTGICVFFCLLLNYLFSAQVALISSLAAIVSMQSTLQSTMKTAVGRIVGTAIGGLAGMALLPMAEQVQTDWLYLAIMPVGMILIIYVCVLIGVPDSASICAFVYITVLIVPFNPNSHGNAYMMALQRIADTAVGIVIALLVNRFIAPPKPKPVTNLRIQADTFSGIYDRVADQLTGTEELILLDSGLINPDLAKTGFNPADSEADTISIPVPTEFAKAPYIEAVYIGPDYSVQPMDIPQRNGYIDLPAETYPVTVVWHVKQATGHETYGLLHRRKPKGTLSPASLKHMRQLRMLRPVRPAAPQQEVAEPESKGASAAEQTPLSESQGPHAGAQQAAQDRQKPAAADAADRGKRDSTKASGDSDEIDMSLIGSEPPPPPRRGFAKASKGGRRKDA